MNETLLRGHKSNARMQQSNVRQSCRALQCAIEKNFPDGFQMITLWYDGVGKTRRWIDDDIKEWIRFIRLALGGIKYIISKEPGNSAGIVTCRVIVDLEVDAEGMAWMWKHGATKVERVNKEGVSGFARVIMARWLKEGHTLEPCRRAWVRARGM